MRAKHLCFLLFFCTACHTVEDELAPPPPPEVSNADYAKTQPPVTQIRQTLNLEPAQTFEATMRALERRDVRVAVLDRRNGLLETQWVPMRDSVCRGHRANNAPLTCRTRISVKVESVPQKASALNIRYKEVCSFNEEISLECPDSSAERLLFSIVDEVRAIDEQRAPKKGFWGMLVGH